MIRGSKNYEVWIRNVDKLICKCTWKQHFVDGLNSDPPVCTRGRFQVGKKRSWFVFQMCFSFHHVNLRSEIWPDKKLRNLRSFTLYFVDNWSGAWIAETWSAFPGKFTLIDNKIKYYLHRKQKSTNLIYLASVAI